MLGGLLEFHCFLRQYRPMTYRVWWSITPNVTSASQPADFLSNALKLSLNRARRMILVNVVPSVA
eukprot:2026492-Amphidinium_carterae.1